VEPTPTPVEGPLDPSSAAWLCELTAEGSPREDAVRRLHALLLRACRAELGRRAARAGLTGPDVDDLAAQAASDATLAVLGKLDASVARAGSRLGHTRSRSSRSLPSWAADGAGTTSASRSRGRAGATRSSSRGTSTSSGPGARIDERKAEHNAKVAERDGEEAADYAEFTIDFAYNAIEEAEYAVLDAVLASVDAEAAASKVPS
jgi:hypothetical protein